MKNKTVVTVFIIGSILIIGGMLLSSNNAKRNSLIFENANIDGSISYVGGGSNGTSYFKIENSIDKYIFFSIQDSSNDNTAFHDAAEIEDKVVKKTGSKYLILKKKNGKEYIYKLKN